MWPESTLYFECVVPGQEASVKRAQPKNEADAQQSGFIYSELTNNLSVNNVYVQLDLSECNDRCRQVVERQKAAIELFVSHQ